MRLILTNSPRSGNTWVRCVLKEAYGLEDMAFHRLSDIPGDSDLPENLILQIHWYREPSLQALIARNGFRNVVIARHPLDILLSVLHFVRHEPDTTKWLEGNVELPSELKSATPTSSTFLDYALSWGAENLLSITYLWWHDCRAIRTRYEDLVASPQKGFERLAQAIGLEPRAPLSKAVENNSLPKFQSLPNHHGWQGQPGLWKLLITPGTAFKIYTRYKNFFKALGYGFELHYLSTRQAQKNWDQLVR